MQSILTYISLYNINYKNEVEYLKKYLTHLEEGVQVRNKEMSDYLNEDIKDAGIENEVALRDVYRDDLIKLPSYYYHSSFLLIYSLLESTLQKICKELYIQLNLPIKPDELIKKNYLEGSLKYIRCFTSLSKDLDNKGNDFIPYQKVRNLIVHNGSTLEHGTDLKKNLLFRKDITYETDGTFYINNIKFLQLFLNKVDEFISDCTKQIHSLEIVPVALHDKAVIKYYTLDEFNRIYHLPSELEESYSDLPF